MKIMTAQQADWLSCHVCRQLARPEENAPLHSQYCPRCNAQLHSRLPNSLGRTWALVISALILYIPANTLPVMSVVVLGDGNTDTIFSGVLHLLEAGMWPLALVVFVASLLIPILKLITLTGLLVSIHIRSSWRLKERSYLYRLTEFVGRWSMVDIFVIAILVALVQFGALADIEAGAGALSFAAVVILTMFAAHSFDPRLMWDVLESTPNSPPSEPRK
ncbi:MAG: paraquat-inducible protein A [bacterium]